MKKELNEKATMKKVVEGIDENVFSSAVEGVYDDSQADYVWVQIVFHGMVGFEWSGDRVNAYVLKTHPGYILVPTGVGEGMPMPLQGDKFDWFRLKGDINIDDIPLVVPPSCGPNGKWPADDVEWNDLSWLLSFKDFIPNDAKLVDHQNIVAMSHFSISFKKGEDGGRVWTYCLEGTKVPHETTPEFLGFKKSTDALSSCHAIARGVVFQFEVKKGHFTMGNDKSWLKIKADEHVVMHVVNYDDRGCGGQIVVDHFSLYKNLYTSQLGPVDVTANLCRCVPNENSYALNIKNQGHNGHAMRERLSRCKDEACPPALL